MWNKLFCPRSSWDKSHDYFPIGTTVTDSQSQARQTFAGALLFTLTNRRHPTATMVQRVTYRRRNGCMYEERGRAVSGGERLILIWSDLRPSRQTTVAQAQRDMLHRRSWHTQETLQNLCCVWYVLIEGGKKDDVVKMGGCFNVGICGSASQVSLAKAELWQDETKNNSVWTRTLRQHISRKSVVQRSVRKTFWSVREIHHIDRRYLSHTRLGLMCSLKVSSRCVVRMPPLSPS